MLMKRCVLANPNHRQSLHLGMQSLSNSLMTREFLASSSLLLLLLLACFGRRRLMLKASQLSNVQINELAERLMTREFLASSSSLTAMSLSNFQTNELVEQLDDKEVCRRQATCTISRPMSLPSSLMTREFLASSLLLTAKSLSNFQINELVEQLDDKEMPTASHLSNFQTNELVEQLDDKGFFSLFRRCC